MFPRRLCSTLSFRTFTNMVALCGLSVLAFSQPASAATTWESVKESGVLKVCGVDGLLPYSSSDPQVPGFEVEIAQELASRLGVKAEYEWVSWDALIPALTSKRCDAIVNGMFITEERDKIIDFSMPYYGSGETILVRKGDDSVHGLEDLKSKKVGVLAGSVTVNFLEEKGIGELAVYPDQNTVILELNNERIDAAYLEAPSAAWTIQNDKSLNIQVVESYIPDEVFNAGVGLREEDNELKAKINEALTSMLDDDAVAKILKKYGVPFFPPKA